MIPTIANFQGAACIVLAALLGCTESTEEPGAKIYTFAVGVFDADGNFTEADFVPHETGSSFGYELTVYSTSGKVRVREILDLPAAGVWSDNNTAPPGITVLQQRSTKDGKRHIEELEIECGSKMAKFGQVYEVADADPAGTYKFTIYIDDQLVEEARFQVGKKK